MDEAADVSDVGVVGCLLILVVEDVDDFCGTVHPYIQWCDWALLIIFCCVDIEVDEGVLLLKLLKILVSWLHWHLQAAVDKHALFSHN